MREAPGAVHPAGLRTLIASPPGSSAVAAEAWHLAVRALTESLRGGESDETSLQAVKSVVAVRAHIEYANEECEVQGGEV